MAVERNDMAGAQTVAQIGERRTPGETQHQIEVGEASWTDIVERLAAANARQRHRRVEIIEDAERLRLPGDDLARPDAIRTIGSHHRHIGVGDIGHGAGFDTAPVRIKDKFAARDFAEIAGSGIVGHVLLVENDVMVVLGQGPAQAAPQRGMTVSPGRADREAEDDDLHGEAASLMDRILLPQSPMTIVLTPAGLISIVPIRSSDRSRQAKSAALITSPWLTAMMHASGWTRYC